MSEVLLLIEEIRKSREALRKIEYGMLDHIEAFTNESLLRRMAEEKASYQHEDLPEVNGRRSSLAEFWRT